MRRPNQERLSGALWLTACLWAAAAVPASAAFEDLGAGARAPGMGNVFTALADDVYAIHYNPAGLALLERPEVGASYARLFLGLSDSSDLGTGFLGYAHPLRRGLSGTVGASFEQFSLDSDLYQEQTFTLAYARLLGKALGPGRLYGGLNLKYLRRSFGSFPEASNAVDTGGQQWGQPDPVLSGRSSMGTFDFDLGGLYRLRKHYSVGLALLHLPQPNVAFESGDSDRLPLGFKLGLNYRSMLSNLGMEYETRTSPAGTQDQNIGLAAERWFSRLYVGDFGIRGALNIGSRSFRQLTYGLSYRTRRIAVDYGFSLPINSIASTAGSHRFGISFRFGSVREPDESVLMLLDAMRQFKRGAVPDLRILGVGLRPAQRVSLEESLALAQSLQARARYQAALEPFGSALEASPVDPGRVKSFGRLEWVAARIESLPNYRTNAAQAAWHQGILAYLAGNDVAAVDKVTYALSLRPGYEDLKNFLARLERATGIRRPDIRGAVSPKRYRVAQLLARAASAIEGDRYDDAIELSREVLRIEGDNLAAWKNLGTSYFAHGDYKKSLSAWEKAYALEKSSARRSVIRGYLKSLRSLLGRFKPKPKAAVRRPSPQEIQRRYNAGVDFYTAGHLEEAKESFAEVLRLDPAYAQAAKALKRVTEELSPR